MISKEAIQEIQSTAVKAAGQKIFTCKAEPDHVYFVENPDGSIEKKQADPLPARLACDDIRSVVAVVSDVSEPDEEMELWVSERGVVGVFDGGRRDRASLTLTISPQFSKLCEWNGKGYAGETLDQVTVYTLFRSLFRDCLNAHTTIRDDIRKVDINKAQQAAGEVSRTAVSMSKKLIAEASGADRLPEVLTFDVPIWQDAIAPIRAKVQVAFDLDPQSEKFRFIVLPCEIDAASTAGIEWLERQVKAASEEVGLSCPIYRGQPE